MMPGPGSRRRLINTKYVVLACLYTAQTMPGHFATNAIPIIMRCEGISLERIGLLGLIGLPWALKFLWAPAVDRYGGHHNHYRKWVLAMQPLFALATFAASFFSIRDDLGRVAALMTVSFAFAATQDIAVDAYAVKMLDHAERAMGNAVQTGGNMLGVALGSSAAFIIYLHTCWQTTLVALSAATLLLGLPMVFARETSFTPAVRVSFSDAVTFFRIPYVGRWMSVALPVFGAVFSAMTMCKPLLVDRGYDHRFISIVLGIFPLAGVPAALLTGVAIRRWGRRYIFMACCLSAAACCCAFIPVSAGRCAHIMIFASLTGIYAVFAMLITVLNTTAMGFARMGREGTDFTLFMAISFVGGMLCVGASGIVAQIFGYAALFAGSAVLSILSCGVFALSLCGGESPVGKEDVKHNRN